MASPAVNVEYQLEKRAAAPHHVVLFIIIVAVAALLRLHSLGDASFGHDEAWRANWSDHGGLGEWRRLPPLQLALLYGLQHTVGRGEFVLRLPFALAGVACVVILYSLTKRHFDARAALLVAAVAALHPVLIQYSRSIKEFSIEALACATLIAVGLAFCKSPTRRSLIAFMLTGLICTWSTFTGVLVATAWLPAVGWRVWRSEHRNTLQWPLGAGVVGLAISAGACALWYSGCSALDAMKSYYDTQEVMFPVSYRAADLSRWLLASAKGITQFVLDTRDDWPPISWCIATVQAIAAAAAIGTMWRKHRPLCVMVVVLTAELAVLGATRMWPIGRVRTITFLIPIAALIIGCGMWEIVKRLGPSAATIGLLAIGLAVPAAVAAGSTLLWPRPDEHVRPMIDRMRANLKPGDGVFVYYGAGDSFEYYVDVDELLRDPDNQGPAKHLTLRWNDADVPILVQPVSDRENADAFTGRIEDWINQHPRTWFLFAHNWKDERRQWVNLLQTQYDRLESFESNNASAHLFARKEASFTATDDASKLMTSK